MAQLDDFSRFKTTDTVIVNGQVTYGRWSPPPFITTRPPDNQIQVFKVTSATEGRPDLIANAIYGTPLLDWVLIAFNEVREPLNWPRAGDLVEYPIESIVFPALL